MPGTSRCPFTSDHMYIGNISKRGGGGLHEKWLPCRDVQRTSVKTDVEVFNRVYQQKQTVPKYSNHNLVKAHPTIS